MAEVNVLIPSRKRVDGLRRAINSVFQTAKHPAAAVQVFVKLDEDDDDSVAVVNKWEDMYNHRVSFILGPRLRGYASLNLFYTRLERYVAPMDWCVAMNDDAEIVTPGWDQALLKLPKDVLLAQFWIEGVNERPEGGPFPAWRAHSWRQLVEKDSIIPDPIDYQLDRIYREAGAAWVSLDHYFIRHNRASDEELAEHRRLG